MADSRTSTKEAHSLAAAAENVVWALEEIAHDRSITAAGRALAHKALVDARAVQDALHVE